MGSGADGERRLRVQQVQGWGGGTPGSRPRPQVLCRGSLACALCRLCGLTAPEQGHSFSSPASVTDLYPGALTQSFPKVAAEPRGELLVECSGLGEGSKPRNLPRTLSANEVRPPLGSGPSNLTLD